jgi:hypothetical protein
MGARPKKVYSVLCLVSNLSTSTANSITVVLVTTSEGVFGVADESPIPHVDGYDYEILVHPHKDVGIAQGNLCFQHTSLPWQQDEMNI